MFGPNSTRSGGSPVEPQGGHSRHLVFVKLLEERVLLGNLLVAPAIRTVELDDHWIRVLQVHEIDTVLVAVQRDQSAIADEANRFEGIEDGLRGEADVGRAGARGHRLSHAKRRYGSSPAQSGIRLVEPDGQLRPEIDDAE